MPRIPENELQRLKREVSLAVLCRDYGIELKQMGPDNLMGRCPFHEDSTPSFGVTPSKNLWNCLGGCGGGDTLQLVMKKEGVSFRHAVEILRRKTGETPAAPVLKTRQGTQHPVLVDPATAMADHALLKHVADFYHQTFLNDPKAMKYLEQRKCFHPEAVKLFRLGYANRTLGYRVPSTTAEGKKLKAQLQRLGILRESGHEHLTGSVVVPIFETGPDGPTATSRRCMGAKSRPTCARERRCTCICRAIIAPCGTPPHCAGKRNGCSARLCLTR